MDPRRYGAYATERYAVARCIDIYEDEYAIVYPQDDRRPGRPARTSPLYDRFRDAGAVFGVRNGWERPYWFAPAGTEPRDRPSFRRTNWFDAVGKEARAVRERAGVLELSSFSKYEVHGPGADAFLDRLCANRLPPLGRIALTQLLTARGTIECDVTVTRLAPERFLVLSAAVAELHDLDWLRRHAPADGSVTIENVTARWGVLILAGPRARDVLGADHRCRPVERGLPVVRRRARSGWGPRRCARSGSTSSASSGWELHHPIEYQVGLYEALRGAGEDVGLVDFGLRAMDSLRLEKAYRAWGADINTEVTPLEAGLERFVALDKGDFVGRDALLRQQRDGRAEAPRHARRRRARRRLLGERGRLGRRPRRRDHDLGRLRLLARPEPRRGLRRRGGRPRPGPAWPSRSSATVVRPSSYAEPPFDPGNHRPRS